MARNCLHAMASSLVKLAPRISLLTLAGAVGGGGAGGLYGLLFGAFYTALDGQLHNAALFTWYFAAVGAVAGGLTGAFAGVFERAGAPQLATRRVAPRRERGPIGGQWPREKTDASDLRDGTVVLVGENQVIPANGQVVEGMALIDESAITGESSPAVGMAEGDGGSVLGGTRVVSGRILVRLTGAIGPTSPQ